MPSTSRHHCAQRLEQRDDLESKRLSQDQRRRSSMGIEQSLDELVALPPDVEREARSQALGVVTRSLKQYPYPEYDSVDNVRQILPYTSHEDTVDTMVKGKVAAR